MAGHGAAFVAASKWRCNWGSSF